MVITDHDVALINALDTVFPAWVRLLCRRHITGNFVAKARDKARNEMWKPFIQPWKELPLSATEAILEEIIGRMQADYGNASTTDDPLLKASGMLSGHTGNRRCFVAGMATST